MACMHFRGPLRLRAVEEPPNQGYCMADPSRGIIPGAPAHHYPHHDKPAHEVPHDWNQPPVGVPFGSVKKKPAYLSRKTHSELHKTVLSPGFSPGRGYEQQSPAGWSQQQHTDRWSSPSSGEPMTYPRVPPGPSTGPGGDFRENTSARFHSTAEHPPSSAPVWGSPMVGGGRLPVGRGEFQGGPPKQPSMPLASAMGPPVPATGPRSGISRGVQGPPMGQGMPGGGVPVEKGPPIGGNASFPPTMDMRGQQGPPMPSGAHPMGPMTSTMQGRPEQGAVLRSQQQRPPQQVPFQPAPVKQPPPSRYGDARPQKRTGINPEAVPHPALSSKGTKEEQARRQAVVRYYHTLDGKDSSPPSVRSTMVAVDNGNASPRYVRATVYDLPEKRSMFQSSAIPLGLIVTPWAMCQPGEQELQLAEFEQGAPRCRRCGAYVNVHMAFVNNGQQFVCNLCGCATEGVCGGGQQKKKQKRRDDAVPSSYYCAVDSQTQKRQDASFRPELRFGSVEFSVPKGKDDEKVGPLDVVFAIDVTATSVGSGLLEVIVNTLREELPKLPPGARVGLLLFDEELTFFRIDTELEEPHWVIVTAVDDPFVPLPVKEDGCGGSALVDVRTHLEQLDGILASLPAKFASTSLQAGCAGAAMRAGAQILQQSGTGGRLFLFVSSLPVRGWGALKDREKLSLYGTEKERGLYRAFGTEYKGLGVECATAGVGVDVFACAHQFCDLASLGEVCRATGGQLRHYQYFDVRTTAGPALAKDLSYTLMRPCGSHAVIRVRLSRGLAVDHFVTGGAHRRSGLREDMVEWATVDGDSTMAVALQYEEEVIEDPFVQVAMLYTNGHGERRLRVHNLALSKTTSLAALFKSANVDTLMAFFAHQAMEQIPTRTLVDIREELINRCSKILYRYRKLLSANSPEKQLILPEALKLMPVLLVGLMKHAAFASFTGHGGSRHDVRADERVAAMHALLRAGVRGISLEIYPLMYAVHDMPSCVGETEEKGGVILPPVLRAREDRIKTKGVYLVVTATALFMVVGCEASVDDLHLLLGVDSLEQVGVGTRLERLDNDVSRRLWRMLDALQVQCPQFSPQIHVLRQPLPTKGRAPSADVAHRNPVPHLVEDSCASTGADGPMYVSFLQLQHTTILKLMRSGGGWEGVAQGMALWT